MGNRKGAHHHNKGAAAVLDAAVEKRTFGGKDRQLFFSKEVPLTDEDLARVRRYYAKRSLSAKGLRDKGAHGVRIISQGSPAVRHCPSCISGTIFRDVGYDFEEYAFNGYTTKIPKNIDRCELCGDSFPRDVDKEEVDFLKQKFQEEHMLPARSILNLFKR